MKILTAKQMARLDRLSIQKHGISARRLMGNAARACVDVLLEKSPKKPRKVVIACGPGNNGGDGFAVAHFLSAKKIKVECFFLGQVEKLSKEAKYFYDRLETHPTSIQKTSDLGALRKPLKGCDWVVDGLFGTGLNRKLTGLFAAVLRVLNQSGARKLAIDMPSGVSGDTGRVLGEAFRADLTVTFEVPKWGQTQEEAWDYVGQLEVRPIGLSQKELKKMKSSVEWIAEGEVKRYFTPRVKDMNKGKAGRVLIVAGSAPMPGAGLLTALGALRAGAGIVTWAMPEAVGQKLNLKHPEILYHLVPGGSGRFSPQGVGEIRKLASGFHAVAVGPGLGQSTGLLIFLEGILKGVRRPMVLDADALNLIAVHPRLKKLLKGKIMTPHPKEMSRLLGIPLEKVLADRIGLTRRFAERHGVHLVLKGYRSVVASPGGGVWINSTGGPNLAVAGSGDVLTGIIASLLAQGLPPRKALLAGIFLHGRAGDRLAERLGDRGTLSSEIASELPKAIKALLDEG